MLEVYLVSLAVGGLFVALSTLSGGGGHGDADVNADADVDVDADVDADADMDGDLDADMDGDLDAEVDAEVDADAGLHLDKGDLVAHGASGLVVGHGIWLPFFSFKFWTFSSAFFGLTGTLLTLLGTVSSQAVVFPLSLAVGLFCGTGVAYTLHKLKSTTVDSALKVQSFVGETATVVLPFERGALGKIRIDRKDRAVELVATTDEESLARGDEVVIIAVDGDTAGVVRPKRLLGR